MSTAAVKPHIVIVDGQAWTTSLVLAKHFEKQHKSVLRAINTILDGIDPDYRRRNFALTFQSIPGPNGAVRHEPMYRISRDGFALLAMGFTGKKALAWKVKYIQTFNAMEQALLRRSVEPVRKEVPQIDSAEFFLTLFYALGQQRVVAAVLWYLLKQGAHIEPFTASLRKISEAINLPASHAGVKNSTDALKNLGLLEKEAPNTYRVFFDALVQHIESERGGSYPGLGDFVVPDEKKLLH
jgi:Rha family phage regulatory protein